MSDEAKLIEQLRTRIGSLPPDLVVAGDETAALRRFMVARKWDVDKAEDQLRRTLEWRTKEFGVAAFLARANPPRERLALVRALLPSNPHLGFTKAHHPVSLLSLGSADLAVSARDLTTEDVVADFVMRAEFYRDVVFAEASARAGKIVDKEVVMLDVGGVSLRIVKVMPLFKEVNRIGSNFFPERTVHILVLNAPRVFSSLWSMIKPLVDPRTQKKVHILSGGEQQLKVLRTFLEDADIPPSLGGVRALPYISGLDAQATASIYARLDAWLAQRSAAYGATIVSKGSDAVDAPTPVVARVLFTGASQTDAAQPYEASPAPQRRSRRLSGEGASRQPSLSSGPLSRTPSSLTAPDGAAAPLQHALSRASGKLGRESEPVELAADEWRNALFLLVLWAATTLVFAVAAWAWLAGMGGALTRRRK